MPHINGLQFLKGLKTRPIVIFITAYDKYALEGYELDVVDYLLKPVSFDRFLKAVNKAAEYHQFKLMEQTQSMTPAQAPKSDYLFVKSEHKIIKINVKDILYIEGLKDYVKIFTGSKPILTLLSLKYLEEQLPSAEFIRVHRSYIISVAKIDYIGKSRVFIGQASIPVSNFYRDNLFALVNDKLK
jgi:DNA-binding LytR/AlgR family response regulator